MKKYNGKRATALFLTSALIATTMLSGCGKKKVDYMDEDGKKGKSEGGSLSARLGIPESYDGDLDVGESGLKSIKISDPDIIVPDKDSMSVVYYTANDMNNEYKKNIAETFFDKSKGIYLYSWEKPYKGDIEAEIEVYQGLIDDATESGDTESLEWYNEYIDNLKQQLTEATDEREGAGDYSGDEYIGNVGNNQFMLSFMNAAEGLGSYFDISLYPDTSSLKYKPYEGAASAYYYDGEYSDEEEMEDSANKCSMTSDEAVEMATDFLQKCGIEDIVNTGVSDLVWEYDDSSYNILAMENDGYVVTFSRSVDGVAPYAGTTYMLEYLWDDDVFYDAAYETYKVCVDDNGILEASCYDFLKPTGDKEENVELMSWEKVLEALATATSDFYSKNKTSYSSITFNDVRLSYYRIADGDKYKYIPVWIFAQCEEAEGELDEEYPVQLIMLDAVTGELLDLKEILPAEEYSFEDEYLEEDENMDEDFSIDDSDDGSMTSDEDIDADDTDADFDIVDDSDMGDDSDIVDDSDMGDDSDMEDDSNLDTDIDLDDEL